MVSRVKRYFLEIKDFSNTIDLNLPENYKIILEDILTEIMNSNISFIEKKL